MRLFCLRQLFQPPDLGVIHHPGAPESAVLDARRSMGARGPDASLAPRSGEFGGWFQDALGDHGPYNEWYPLTKDQFEAYSAHCEEPLEPFPWQRLPDAE
jgi:hypothetical protein